MNLSKEQQKFAKDIATLINEIYSQGFACSLGEAYRTPEQAELYAKQGKGIKNSLHCKKLAIDLNLFSPEGKYLDATKDHEQFGIFWESISPENRWGGRFKDGNHYERNV